MTTFPTKINVFLRSVVTWALTASFVVTVVMNELAQAAWFPEDAAGQVVKYGTILVSVVALLARVITRVTPVPVGGMEVLDWDGVPQEVGRGWE
jgi:hypothetical protein